MLPYLKTIFSAIPKSAYSIAGLVIIIIFLVNINLDKSNELIRLQTQIETLNQFNKPDTTTKTIIKRDTIYITKPKIVTKIDSVYIDRDTTITVQFEDFYIKGSMTYKWYNAWLQTDLDYKPKFPIYIIETVYNERLINSYINIPLYKERKPTLKFGGGIGYLDAPIGLGSISYDDKRLIFGYSTNGTWLTGLVVDF